MDLRFEKQYPIKGDLELIWECIADEENCSLWQGDDCTIGTQIGDEVSIFGGSVIGKILAIEPMNLLSYSWRGKNWSNTWQDSVVEYHFKEIDGVVNVTIIHKNFPNEEERSSHALGWDIYFFEPMIEFILNAS